MNIVVIHTTEKPKVVGIHRLTRKYANWYLAGTGIERCAPIELVERGIELLANDEGILSGLDPNENLFPFFVPGNVIAVGYDHYGCFTGLTKEQEEYLFKWLEALKTW